MRQKLASDSEDGGSKATGRRPNHRAKELMNHLQVGNAEELAVRESPIRSNECELCTPFRPVKRKLLPTDTLVQFRQPRPKHYTETVDPRVEPAAGRPHQLVEESVEHGNAAR